MRALCITSHSDRPETETFIGLQRLGVDIHVMCPASAPHRDRLLAAGVPVEELALKGRIDRRGIARIRARLAAQPFDLIHAFNNKAVSNALIAARGYPVCFIAYRGIVGNVSFVDPASWMTYLHPRVDRIVCVAEAIREFLLDMKLLWLRVPPERVVTIHKGHDLSWYDAKPADLQTLGIPPGAFVVGTVANLRPRKGIDVLVDAAGRLAQDAGMHFLLVGNMQSPALDAAIAASPARERIHLAGFRRDAPALMAACDVFVLPAIKREGLPKVVIEAMAYGVPPIVTDSGGSPELVVDGESGMVVASGSAPAIAEAITGLRADEPRRARMGQAARVRIGEHFRIEDTISKTHALYASLLDAPPRAGAS